MTKVTYFVFTAIQLIMTIGKSHVCFSKPSLTKKCYIYVNIFFIPKMELHRKLATSIEFAPY